MKAILALIVFFCLLNNLLSQTENKSIPKYLPSEYEQTIDSTTCFKSGRGGLFRTTDNGVSWENIFCDVKTYNLDFYSKDEGYLVTEDAVIKTTDGGKNWKNYFLINRLLGQNPKDLTKFFAEITKHSLGDLGNSPTANLITNYPNPFNPITRIKYEVKNPSQVLLNVFDVSGREVAVLVNERKAVGIYEVNFDGNSLTSGTYFYRLTVDEITETKKMILIK